MAKAPLPTDVTVGLRIRLRRNELGISQEKLGDKLGVTFQQVQKYEKGTNRVGASRLEAVAKALEVPVSYFFDGQPAEPSKLGLLQEPGVLELVSAYSRITEPRLRRAVVELARNLARVAISDEERQIAASD